mmetsp:Transcript_33861/g.72962  ORF Transcript_33861/g.72962 Transcript_33861/m.72962 type:complete len:202 (-) Transcript_33861:225-830(-)
MRRRASSVGTPGLSQRRRRLVDVATWRHGTVLRSLVRWHAVAAGVDGGGTALWCRRWWTWPTHQRCGNASRLRRWGSVSNILSSSYNGCSRLCKSRSAHHRRSLHLSPSSLSSSSTPKSPRQRTQIQPCWTSSGGVSCPGSIALTTLFALSHTSQWADRTLVGRVEWQSTQKRLHRWSSRQPSFVSMSTVSVCMSAWLGSS